MKLLIIDQFGRQEEKESGFIPTPGMRVNFSSITPMHVVKEVICWPSNTCDLSMECVDLERFDAIVLLGSGYS